MMPSSCMMRRAMAMASSQATGSTRSISARSRLSGMKLAPMPWILCGAGVIDSPCMRWVMMADGGFEVAFHGEYREIVPGERLVFTEVFEGIPDADASFAVVTIDFAESAGRTTLSMLVEHQNQTFRDMHVQSGMEEGMQGSLDSLEDVAAVHVRHLPADDADIK